MLQQEYPYIDLNGKDDYTKIKHYSDLGYEILQIETGNVYSEAVDVYPSRYTYAELTPVEDVEAGDAVEGAEADDAIEETAAETTVYEA